MAPMPAGRILNVSTMLKVLVPVDDSEPALRAVRQAAFMFKDRCVSQVVLLNVQPALEQGRASAYRSLDARSWKRNAGSMPCGRHATSWTMPEQPRWRMSRSEATRVEARQEATAAGEADNDARMRRLKNVFPMLRRTTLHGAKLLRLPPAPLRDKSPQHRRGALRIRADGSFAIHRTQLVESRKIALAVDPVASDHKMPRGGEVWTRARGRARLPNASTIS